VTVVVLAIAPTPAPLARQVAGRRGAPRPPAGALSAIVDRTTLAEVERP